jgi:hypothetical protein
VPLSDDGEEAYVEGRGAELHVKATVDFKAANIIMSLDSLRKKSSVAILNYDNSDRSVHSLKEMLSSSTNDARLRVLTIDCHDLQSQDFICLTDMISAQTRISSLTLNIKDCMYCVVPLSVTSIQTLNTLNVYSNKLTGAIPPELSALSALTTLALDGNQLTGAIPPELSALAALTRLKSHGNQLTGAIPPELSALTALTMLGLHGNQLTGAIPPELSALRALTTLGLHDNDSRGRVPSGLFGISGLQLFVNGNKKLVIVSKDDPLDAVRCSKVYVDRSWHSLLVRSGVPAEVAGRTMTDQVAMMVVRNAFRDCDIFESEQRAAMMISEAAAGSEIDDDSKAEEGEEKNITVYKTAKKNKKKRSGKKKGSIV